ncbi:FG-GAP repeat domain-containing protein [Pleomorphovibrio marinus]|uniref:FG-GAP repeat domain-containing protein n=1 Tax=Pleomorphovibrio marinus TaxID=2164132 RepID=UPI000E0A5C58|nr:VCBS repeat-containing protein [Pleomorphovibrio marinus]
MHAFLFFILLFLLPSNDPPKNPIFEEQVLDDQVAIGYGLAIGDVDGDGKPDILLVDKKEFVWYRNGDWKRFVMVKDLTEYDNVCIAARDITGDGKVEVAVGAQWNPGETSDMAKSGSVHYLQRPEDPTQLWTPIALPHEPTVHRMAWAKTGDGKKHHLIMVPLHGRGNKGGEGDGVNIIAYEMPDNPETPWKTMVIDQSMHMTHNLDVYEEGNGEAVYIGGKEGVKVLTYQNGEWKPRPQGAWLVEGHGFGELRIGKNNIGKRFLTGIEPIHGNLLTTYMPKGENFTKGELERQVLSDQLKQGHGLATADLLEQGTDQIVVGWRDPNDAGELGVQLYSPQGDGNWEKVWIDENGMACEDLKVADLDGDGKPDIIAAGRETNNLKIYWNKSN